MAIDSGSNADGIAVTAMSVASRLIAPLRSKGEPAHARLHTLWSPGRGPLIWGLDGDRPVKSPSQAVRSSRPHPFAADAAALTEAHAGKPASATLLLPSLRMAPLDSPALVRLTPVLHRNGPLPCCRGRYRRCWSIRSSVQRSPRDLARDCSCPDFAAPGAAQVETPGTPPLSEVLDAFYTAPRPPAGRCTGHWMTRQRRQPDPPVANHRMSGRPSAAGSTRHCAQAALDSVA